MSGHPTHRRPRSRGGAAATLPWLRAPVLLLRRPVVFLAIVGATAILAIAAASGPLFLSTIGTASLHSQALSSCPENSLPGMSASLPAPKTAAAERRGVATMARHGLPGAYTTAMGQAQVQSSLVHLFSRDDALQHVRKLTPAAGPGAWVPDTFAGKLGVRPGDTITTTRGARLRVAGIYRDLAPDPFKLADLPAYWCTWTNAIVSTVASDQAIASTAPSQRQGPLLIVDTAAVQRASDGPVQVTWHMPMSTTANPLGAFDRANARAAAAARDAGFTPDPHLGQLAARAHTARDGLSGSIIPIEITGVVIAALLVGGAGLFWANARHREVRLLVARGIGPVALGAKAILETLLPALLGAGLGLLGTILLVRGVGPASVLERGASATALGLAAAMLGAGLLVIGIIGTLAGRDRTVGRRRSWLRLVPWELVPVGLAVAIATNTVGSSAVRVDHAIVKISPLIVLYPLLGAAGALLLLGRVISWLLPGAGRAARRTPNPAYLAIRRISRSRAIAIGVIVGTALPCCLLMYGSSVSSTVRHEVAAKYQTNLGAPHVLQIYGVDGALFSMRGAGSQVVVYDQDVKLGGQEARVLGVDTKTFADFAFTDSRQRSQIGKLAPDRPDGTVPAILVNDGGSARDLVISQTKMSLHPVARDAVFPGLRDRYVPLVVVDQRALSHVDNGTERTNQVWTDAAHYGIARRIIDMRHYSVLFELTSQVVIGETGLLPVSWLFGYLRALAILIGLVALAGLVFALGARTRKRRVSYVLSRRMGMSKSTHVGSLLVELLTVVGLGWVAGSGLGIGSFGFIYGDLDVYPSLPPGVRFVVPGGPLAVSAIIAAAVVMLTAIGAHALAERTRPGEILRLE